MSRDVATIFGKQSRRRVEFNSVQWPLPYCLTGLEIEAEQLPNTVMPESYFPFWNRIKDGSLRNGHEYVLAMPLKGDTLAQSIHELFANNTKFERSATGSTHIHLDMFEEGVRQDIVKLMIMLMYTFEGAIFAIADRAREWCGYTNKLTSAPEILIAAVLNASENDDYMEFAALCQDRIGRDQLGRYYGINVMALAKYGSLEFRYFPTATSAEELVDWIILCQSFKLAAIELGTMEKFIETLESDELYDEFLTRYFSKWRDVFMQEIPQSTAIGNMRKALAVASTQALSKMQESNEPFDEKAILGNKVLSKFMKNKVKTGVMPLLIIRTNQMVPPSIRSTPGTVMYHAGRFYVAAFDQWLQAPYHPEDLSYGSKFTDAHRHKALASLRRYVPTLTDKLNEAGITPTAISTAVVRAQQAILYLEDRLRVEHVPVSSYNQPVTAHRQVFFAPPQARLSMPESTVEVAVVHQEEPDEVYESYPDTYPEDEQGDDE